jgi:putative transposase
MRAIDRVHLQSPFAGARMMKKLLLDEGFKVGRRHVRTRRTSRDTMSTPTCYGIVRLANPTKSGHSISPTFPCAGA